MDPIKAIEDALAAGPTPGPWAMWGRADPSQAISAAKCFVAQTVGGNDSANAAYIAACHPEAIRSLLDRLREAEARYMDLVMLVGNKHPGESRHETAARYIRQAEVSRESAAMKETP